MTIQLDPTQLAEFLSRATFSSNGDDYERKYGHFLSKEFPNCEKFWQVFVVPLTRRMQGYPNELAPDISVRESVDSELENIAFAHYSMFMNLVYAHLHLEAKLPFSLADVYVHLGAACDLMELVLERWYLLLLRCRGEESHILQKLTRTEFLRIAEEWYDDKYPGFYTHYLSKGKSPPLRLPSRASILEEYLSSSQHRKDYVRQSQAIREFRNVIVHDVVVGKLIDQGGRVFIPRPQVIQEYRSWRKVAAVASNTTVIQKDFAEQYTQAKEDTAMLESSINNLWETMIAQFLEELYAPGRSVLRGMFGLGFASTGPLITASNTVVRTTTEQIISGSGTYVGGSVDVIRQEGDD